VDFKEQKPMISDREERNILDRYIAMKPYLYNEQLRRIYAASEAKVIGYGGITILSKITGLDRETISRGIKELENPDNIDTSRVRNIGGGRKKIEEIEPEIKEKLQELMESSTCGSPQSALKWTKKSLHNIEAEMKEMGFEVSHTTIHRLLTELDYSMQGNQKAIEGNSQHPDRNEQFEHINSKVKEFQEKEQPVISVDTKKKELVGNFKNGGKEYHLKGQPIKVNGHDFEEKDKGSVRPYGVYDIKNNQGWVNVGTDRDTASFAVESIRRWWYTLGCNNYPNASEILITADGGGSNGSRTKLWKYELQKLAMEINLDITVCHYPPGTSKWNAIEHRMFSYISQNWRGRPLESHEVIINLIGSTTTKKGLNIKCMLDNNKYEKGIKITDEQLESINIIKDETLSNWNYTIKHSLKY
jgi:hypothetical protein